MRGYTAMRTYWRLCCAGVVCLSVLALSPFVIPEHVAEPMLFGMPRTLWAGILITMALVAVTVAGAYFHPGHVDDHERSHFDARTKASCTLLEDWLCLA